LKVKPKAKKRTETPFEKEVKRLHAIGKSPDIIAIRLGAKMSKVLTLIANPAV
jgi:DNA-binding CsgD family transcriptional regulator